MAAATEDGANEAIGRCLTYAVEKGINSTDLAVVLAPICIEQGEVCCRQLIGLNSPHSWDVIEHSHANGVEFIPESEDLEER